VPDVAAGEQRAGSSALLLFINPLNARVLRAHVAGRPSRLADVQAAVGPAPESSVRAAITSLCEVGALERSRVGGSPRAVATQLNPAGEELLFVAGELDAWLAHAPGGPIDPDSEEARGAIKALAGGWSTSLVRELAVHPVTLSELDEAIPEISYPMLERRINWMRRTGQIEAVQREGRGIPYIATDWLRRAIAPLCASGRFERRYLRDLTPPITEVEVEGAFLLAIPLARLPVHSRGTCLLAAKTSNDRDRPPAAQLSGVTVEVEGGEVRSFGPSLDVVPRTWAIGSPNAWLDAVIEGDIERLRVNGARPQLALDLVAALHAALFVER
jgi:DNA-binding HxlR family transcriptional regulator